MTLRYFHIVPETAPPSIQGGAFRAVLLAEQAVSDDWRNQIAIWLVENGCRYAITWGLDCEAWHDSIDWANLQALDFRDIPDQNLVMTTWHANEPLSEAFWFAGNCATHPAVDLRETIIIHVTREAQGSRILRLYHDAQEFADDDDGDDR